MRSLILSQYRYEVWTGDGSDIRKFRRFNHEFTTRCDRQV